MLRSNQAVVPLWRLQHSRPNNNSRGKQAKNRIAARQEQNPVRQTINLRQIPVGNAIGSFSRPMLYNNAKIKLEGSKAVCSYTRLELAMRGRADSYVVGRIGIAWSPTDYGSYWFGENMTSSECSANRILLARGTVFPEKSKQVAKP